MAQITKNSLVKNFLDLMGGEWAYNVPLTTQWAVAIVPDAGGYGNPDQLFRIIKDYTQIDAHSFYIPIRVQQKLLNENTQPNLDGLGLYFAQGVTIARESFSVNGVGIENSGGYLKGIVASDRLGMSDRKLSIEFLETNLDFVDGLIRPWIIAASYKGLINTGEENSIKCTISIQEFTREKSIYDMKPQKRLHVFGGCVPLDVEDRVLKYDSEPTEAPTSRVSWMFEKYTYEVDPENYFGVKF